MIEVIKKIHENIPPRLSVVFSPFVTCFVFLKNLRHELWIVQGEEKGSGLPLSILISCRDQDRNLLLQLIYGNSNKYKEFYIGSAWQWDISKKIKKYGTDCSFMLVEVANSQRNLLREANWFYIPRWVTGVVDIPCSSEIMKSKSIKNDLRKIRKNAFQYEVTQDPQRFDEFYHNMYVPYVIEAHGKGAFIDSYKALLEKFRNGELLLVKKQDTFIGGSLILYEKNGPHLFRGGILNGDRKYINDGAMAALYNFSYIYMVEKGFKKVNLGLSRPFLRDGVLRYKRKWSLRISGSYFNGFALKVLSDSSATRCFLQNNPFIFENNGVLYGAIFVDNKEPLSSEDIKLIEKDLFIPGLSKLLIYCFEKGDMTRQDIVPPEFSAYIELRSAEDIFKEHSS